MYLAGSNDFLSPRHQLVIGGQMMDRAAQQEQELRKANRELEDRELEERRVAEEVAAKEEATLQMEDNYKSLQEEADAKSVKLKKVVTMGVTIE
jgi:kinesin family protein 3/17